MFLEEGGGGLEFCLPRTFGIPFTTVSVEELVIHAGLPKTGTSALQYALGISRKELSREGYLLPPYFWGQPNHKLIPLSCRSYESFLESSAANPAGRQLGFNTVRMEVEAGRLYLALKTYRSAHKKVILTAESFSALRTEEELKNVKKALSVVPYRSLKLVVYVRSPINHYVSQVLQAAKARGRTDALGKFDRIQKVVNFIRLWDQVFGGSIDLHLYGRDFDNTWDIAADFSANVLEGFPLRTDTIPVNRRNASVSPEGASLIVDLRRRRYPNVPPYVKPLEVHQFAEKVGEVERLIARDVAPRLKPRVRRKILSNARGPVETLISQFGLPDERGLLFADEGELDSYQIVESALSYEDIDDVFEIDQDYRSLLAGRLAAL